MVPKPIGSAKLHIHKTFRRLPLGDLGSPPYREAMHADSVVDKRPRPHRDWRRRKHLEIQPGWRDHFQVPGFGKERKDLVARPWKPNFGLKSIFLQCVSERCLNPLLLSRPAPSIHKEAGPDRRAGPLELFIPDAVPRPLRHRAPEPYGRSTVSISRMRHRPSALASIIRNACPKRLVWKLTVPVITT